MKISFDLSGRTSVNMESFAFLPAFNVLRQTFVAASLLVTADLAGTAQTSQDNAIDSFLRTTQWALSEKSSESDISPAQ